MKNYIITNSITNTKRKVTEEQLENIFRANSFVIFNERDYNAWKQTKIEEGTLAIAE